MTTEEKQAFAEGVAPHIIQQAMKAREIVGFDLYSQMFCFGAGFEVSVEEMRSMRLLKQGPFGRLGPPHDFRNGLVI